MRQDPAPSPSPRPFHTLPWAAIVVVGFLPACSPKRYEMEANREVYAAVARKRARVPEVVGSLDVDAAQKAAEPARDLTEVTLDLDGALSLAAKASREVRDRREDVYLTALAWTAACREYRGKAGLGGRADLTVDSDGTTVSATSPEATFTRALEEGGSLVLRFATDFLKTLGDPVATARSILSADLVLPLAQGHGPAAREALVQAERDLLYSLRSFARFQQEFSARIAGSFYRAALSRTTLSNEDLTVKSLQTVFERAEAFGPRGAGRLPDFQVDQARQDLLRAQDRRVRAQQAYEAALDSLKIELGLPVTTRVSIAEGVLEDLAKRGMEPPSLDAAKAIATAIESRLDVKNARDQREDADRKVEVAANGLGPRVDLTLGADLETPATQPANVEKAKGTFRPGLDVDLPVERTAERNAYRSAQIQSMRAKRAVEGLMDQVTAQVRDSLRALEQAAQSYELQEESVRLATRRVESADLNLQAGKATTRDLLEAEDALVEARNALAAALVDYAIARIEFERDAGTLRP